MGDTTFFLQLSGAHLGSIEQDNKSVTLHFSQVHLIQEMEGAFEDSLWTQAVDLTIQEALHPGDLPATPCEIDSGDLINNIFTYRNHVPLPIDWHGDTSCTLTVADSKAQYTIAGNAIRVERLDHPRYLRHIRK